MRRVEQQEREENLFNPKKRESKNEEIAECMSTLNSEICRERKRR
jgi:hypothetical protein